MAVDDVATALMALDDDEIRLAVAGGDLTALGDHSLTEEERDLVVGAAGEDAEVSGFAAADSRAYQALGYVSANQAGLSVNIANQFKIFTNLRFGQDREVPSCFGNCGDRPS